MIAADASEIGASATVEDASATVAACWSVVHALATVVSAKVTVAYEEGIASMDAVAIETCGVRETAESAMAIASVMSGDAAAIVAPESAEETENVATARGEETSLVGRQEFSASVALVA